MATLTTNTIADFTDWWGWSQSVIVKAPTGGGWASGKYLYVHTEDRDNLILCYSDDGVTWSQEVIYTTTDTSLTGLSVLVDSNANTYVLWPSSAGSNIHIALIYKTTGSWSSVEEVNYPVASGAFTNFGCCIDKNDKVNVAYTVGGASGGHHYLVHAIRDGAGSWTSTNIEDFDPGTVPYRTSSASPNIATDANGYVHIITSVQNVNTGAQLVEYITNKTGSFVIEQIDGSGRQWQSSSLSSIAVDSSGNVHVTYGAADNSSALDYITYNVKTSGGWQTKVELDYDDNDDGFGNSNVVIHIDNSISVLWGVNAVGGGVYWAHKDSVSGAFDTATKIQEFSANLRYLSSMHGFYPSSLITDGYFVYTYFDFTNDIAYLATYTFAEPINNNSTWNFMSGDTFECTSSPATTWSQLPITTENCA